MYALAETHEQSPGAGYYLGAGAVDFFVPVSAELLAGLPMPDAPGLGASAEDWIAYFDRLSKRTATQVAAQSAAQEREAAETYEGWAKSIPVIGSVAGPIAKQLLKWGIDLGHKISSWIYGKPDWNDPKYVNAAMASVARLASEGWIAYGPFVGPDRASTEDAIDWAENLARTERRFILFGENHPEADAALTRAIAWAVANPDDRRVLDLRNAGLWPLRVYSSNSAARDTIAGVAGLLAAAFDKDQATVVREAFAASDAMNDPKRNEKDPDGTPYRYSDSDYWMGEWIARTVRAAEAAPAADRFGFLDLQPLTFNPDAAPPAAAFSGGSPFGPSDPSPSAGGSAGGGSAVALAAGLGALLFFL